LQALRNGQLNDAECLLAKLREGEPFSVATRGFELELLIKTRKLGDALRLSEECQRLFPQSSRILLLCGQVYFYRKNYARAITCFRESFALSSKPVIQLWLGRAFLNSGRLAEAEPILNSMLERHPWVHRELAWLHEREKDYASAIRSYEEFLKHYPGDTKGKESLIRLKAMDLPPAHLLEEIELQLAMGTKPPVQLFPIYVERLLELGEGKKARAFLSQVELPASQVTGLAWACHRKQAHDLTFELFRKRLKTLDIKALRAMESAAEKCGRIPELIGDYEKLAPADKRFYGRIATLRELLERRNDA
jgi:tetratricopeptide (TPR) repeat protein